MSSKPTKMRKRMATAPSHLASKFTSARLGEKMRSKYNKRSIRLRKGDSVKVMRGEYEGIEGKVTRVFKDGYMSVEGVSREKVAGGTVPVRVHSSKLEIMEINLDDKWRREKLNKGQDEEEA